jgi:hypothetical protein
MMTKTRGAWNGDDPLGWECLTCNAGYGQPCRLPSGRWTDVHRDRTTTAALWARYSLDRPGYVPAYANG